MSDQQFVIGDQVRHRFHGAGSIIKTQSARGGTQYLVQFRSTARWLYADNLTKIAPPGAGRTVRAVER